MYLTYEEYQELGGALEQPVFNRLEMQARSKVDYYTENRLVNDDVLPDGVKLAVMELIDKFYQKSQYLDPSGGIVSSESNDGVSVSYANQSASEFLDSFEQTVSGIIKENLLHAKNQAGTSLLYRGW